MSLAVLASASSPSQDLRSRALIIACWAGAIPFVVYVATLSSHDYWLDSPEFVAAATTLGVAHPPGHPLYSLLTHVVTWVPVGPLALRISAMSAFFSSVALAFFAIACDRTWGMIGLRPTRSRAAVAVGVAWTIGTTSAFWFQSVRPEVYALQACLSAIILERIVAFESAWPKVEQHALCTACVVFGFALTNHHFLALLLLPAAAPTLARLAAERGVGAVLRLIPYASLPLLTYLYLPLRAYAHAPLNLGDPRSLSRIFWVVSAEAFQKNAGAKLPQPAEARVLDVASVLIENATWPVLLLAVIGGYALIRHVPSRRVAYIWIATAVIGAAARAWLGFTRDNPDALGYLMPTLAAMAVIASSGIALTLRLSQGRASVTGSIRGTAFAAVLAVVYPVMLVTTGTTLSRGLGRFVITDVFDDARRRELPHRAIVLAHSPQTIFRHFGSEAADGVRPDVMLVPVPLLPYPGMIDAILDRDPELAPLLRRYLLDRTFEGHELETLASSRSVLFEMDPRVPPTLYPSLAPRGMFYELLPGGAEKLDIRHGARSARDTAIRISQIGADDLASDVESRATVLWGAYNDTIFLSTMLEHELAREATLRGLRIAPTSRELLGLAKALDGVPDGTPVDLRPFLLR